MSFLFFFMEVLLMFAWYQKNRKKTAIAYGIVYVIACYFMLLSYIPKEVVLQKASDKISLAAPICVQEAHTEETVQTERGSDAKGIQKTYTCKLFGLIPIATMSGTVVGDQSVDAVGRPVGIYLQTQGIYVAGLKEIQTVSGEKVSPCAYILQEGDYITGRDGKELSDKEDLQEAVEASKGQAMVLSVVRHGEEMEVKVQPQETEDGSYKLGIWVKDDVAGVGTLTYVKEDGSFGALGHGISATSGSQALSMKEGYLYETSITGITPSSIGSPGEISGLIHYGSAARLGEITRNSNVGIYGKMNGTAKTAYAGNSYAVAYKQEIKREGATILFGEGDAVEAYQIMIDQIDYEPKEKNKSFVFHVTDEKLIDQMGGIVQGMSGSPIIQEGRIIGAVTHVFINDPTKGYGIFIEEML